jgi:phage tail sheath protein FI
MPVPISYPGVYIEEIPSGVRTITGVATSITAFIGRAKRGSVNEPVMIHNFGDYERNFGGLWLESTMSYTVQQYFLNGGSDAVIVRIIHGDATRATINLGANAFTLEAKNEGTWADALVAAVDYDTKDTSDTNLFNITIKDDPQGITETYLNVSIDPDSPRYIKSILDQESKLMHIPGAVSGRPGEREYSVEADGTGGNDGGGLDMTDYTGNEDAKTGMYALLKTDLFNLLCVPPPTRDTDFADTDWDTFWGFCRDRRAVLIEDAPSAWSDTATAVTGIGTFNRHQNAAIFFPRIFVADPLKENRLESFAPCGAVAGVIARTDASRGIWKAPAGTEATMAGVAGLAVSLTDKENGELNPLGVNCLRSLPVIGRVVWGARTLSGADRLASEWKYLSVRRTALYIEESLYRGTQWVVFEPNDEPLWSQIRLNLGAFMHSLFRQGAFQGQTPKDAYFVKCDKETTTQDDINKGIVNIVVGFAPLKPAEFVIIKLQQMAGQIQA